MRISKKEAKELVKAINKVAFDAEICGADNGGSYEQNVENLHDSLQYIVDMLEKSGIDDYIIARCTRFREDGGWPCTQILNKNTVYKSIGNYIEYHEEDDETSNDLKKEADALKQASENAIQDNFNKLLGVLGNMKEEETET